MKGRTDALADAPRPGAARKITDEQVEALVTRTLTQKGRGQDSHWSLLELLVVHDVVSPRSPQPLAQLVVSRDVRQFQPGPGPKAMSSACGLNRGTGNTENNPLPSRCRT
jgi:hypothetical protein